MRKTSGVPARASPSSQSVWAAASVAWPQRSTSTVGVNQRSRHPSPSFRRKAVSERFISAATDCSHASARSSGRMQTAAGFPANGRSVNASTQKIGTLIARPKLSYAVSFFAALIAAATPDCLRIALIRTRASLERVRTADM